MPQPGIDPTTVACANCYYYEEGGNVGGRGTHGGKGATGLCRRFPPGDRHTVSGVTPLDWCGEFRSPHTTKLATEQSPAFRAIFGSSE